LRGPPYGDGGQVSALPARSTPQNPPPRTPAPAPSHPTRAPRSPRRVPRCRRRRRGRPERSPAVPTRRGSAANVLRRKRSRDPLLVQPLRAGRGLVPLDRPIVEVHPDALHLGVLTDRFEAVLAPRAAHLEPAPRGCWVDAVIVVDPDDARADALRNAVRDANVLGPHRGA